MGTFTKKDLVEMWKRSPERQYNIAFAKILEAIRDTQGDIAVCFSGGKDSSLLLDMFCEAWNTTQYASKPVKVCFANTTNETTAMLKFIAAFIPYRPDDLKRVLALTPYSREEYDNAFMPCEDPLEKARRFMIKTNQAIGAKMGSKCGWRNHKQMKIGGTACKWAGITDTIDCAAVRLRGDTTHLVQIEHMDALKLIQRYNNPDVLMYIDPPYVRATRKSGRLYEHEMDDAGHRELLDVLQASKAKIVLSGYDSPMYNDTLAGWYKDQTMSQTTSTEMACETIWMNYQPSGQITMEDI